MARNPSSISSNVRVQFDGAQTRSIGQQMSNGLYQDAAASFPVQQSVQQFSTYPEPRIGLRELSPCPTYTPPNNVSSFPRQRPPNMSGNNTQQYFTSGSFQMQDNESENLAGLLTSLSLGPSRELTQPAESSSLAVSMSTRGDVDSGFVASSGVFTIATNPECAQDRSGFVSESGYASGGLAGILSGDIIEPPIVLSKSILESIYTRRIATQSAVKGGIASVDLLYAGDEDGDTQLHICLYDINQYRAEAWNLVAGSRPDWLSIQNKRGLCPLMLSVMYGSEIQMVRALAILSSPLLLSDMLGNTALHHATHFGRVDLVNAILLEPTPDEYLLIYKFQDNPYGDSLPELSYEQVLARHRSAVAQMLATPNNAGETPLFMAVKGSYFDVTARLLAMRSDPRIPETSEGKTALHLAVQLLQVNIVHILLSYPSPQVAAELLNKQTRDGATPLRSALRMICSDPQQKDARAKIIEMLKNAGGLDFGESTDSSESESEDLDSEEPMRSASSSPASDVRAEETNENQQASY